MKRRGRERFLVAGAFLAGLGAAWALPAAAQSPLEQVERLTRMGRTEEAREALSEWWEGDRSRASRRDLQRGLWLRGRLTVDPVQAELDFQRLAVLYPSGDFTADAILRLAQAAWAMGDEESARRHLETLERDYPRSEALERGRAWMADAGPLPPADQRVRQPAVPTTPRPPAPTSPEVASERRAAALAGSYSVQLGRVGACAHAVRFGACRRRRGSDRSRGRKQLHPRESRQLRPTRVGGGASGRAHPKGDQRGPGEGRAT